MRRPWVVGPEVPGEGIGEGRHGRAAGVVPLEWWGAPGRRHAVRTVIKAMMRPPVLLVLPGSHGQTASRVPWPSDLWAAIGWWLMWRLASSKWRPLMVALGVNRTENRGSQKHHRGGQPPCRQRIAAVPMDDCVRFVLTWLR